MAYEACLPFPFNNSLAKLLPPLKFWSSEVRKEWGLGNVGHEGQKTENLVLGGWVGASWSLGRTVLFWTMIFAGKESPIP